MKTRFRISRFLVFVKIYKFLFVNHNTNPSIQLHTRQWYIHPPTRHDIHCTINHCIPCNRGLIAVAAAASISHLAVIAPFR